MSRWSFWKTNMSKRTYRCIQWLICSSLQWHIFFKNLWSQKKVEMKICCVSTKICSQFEEWSPDTFHHHPKTGWELQWARVRKQVMSLRTFAETLFWDSGDQGEASIHKDIVPLLFYFLFFFLRLQHNYSISFFPCFPTNSSMYSPCFLSNSIAKKWDITKWLSMRNKQRKYY